MERKNKNNRATGQQYEQIALEYLFKNNYRILETNYVCRFGEVDIIARDGSYIVFVEVKYRRNRMSGFGFEAVDIRKQKKLSMCMHYFIMEKKIHNMNYRFDVISIDAHDIRHYTDAFSICFGG
ncbi:MAG: YraN family protein [Suipraeoptans sp.]